MILYCPRCDAVTDHVVKDEIARCPNCGRVHSSRVLTMTLRERVQLTRRKERLSHARR